MSRVPRTLQSTYDKDRDGKIDKTALPDDLAGMTTAAAQVDSVAADVPTLVTDFNALLAKIRAAGLMSE